jgi:hypothetical protein
MPYMTFVNKALAAHSRRVSYHLVDELFDEEIDEGHIGWDSYISAYNCGMNPMLG